MTKKENALRVMAFDDTAFPGGLPRYTLCYRGACHEGYEGGGHDCPLGTRWFDIWGTGWQKEHKDVMGFPRVNPLAEIKALKNYVWPDPNDERICADIYKLRKEFIGGDAFLEGANSDTLWERTYMLVGMENMMCYCYEEPEYAKEILHRIMDFQLGIAKHYLKLGVEMAAFSDDLGSQHGLLIGKDTLYEFLVPEYKRLFELYKKHNVLINFHSCGHVEPILDMFIELGVNILNPVQATANNLVKVKEKADFKMSLLGGVSSDIVMKGPVSAIDAAVKNAIRVLGKNGGYFCWPDQDMPTPQEHWDAFYAAREKYAKYPFKDE